MGRIKSRVKGDVTKSGTNHQLEFGKGEKWVRERPQNEEAHEPAKAWDELKGSC